MTYTFNTHTAKHTFCRICGIHPFYRPRSHPQYIDVNVRYLNGDVVSQFQIVPFDGENWKRISTSLEIREYHSQRLWYIQ